MNRLMIPVFAVLAQVSSEIGSPWVQLGSFGALCFVLWWVLTKQMPADRKAFTESLERIQDRMDKRNNEILAELRKQTDALSALNTRLSRSAADAMGKVRE
jgi:hypothetical protein